MKKSVLRLLAFVIVIALTVPAVLASCNILPPSLKGDEKGECTSHVDADKDGICDNCSERIDGNNEDNNNEDNKNDNNEDNNEDNNNTEDGGDTLNVITVAEAIRLCGESGNVTTERYYIRGTIKTVTNAQYGAMVIEDETGEISVYGTYSADGEIGYADFEYKPVKGDEVLLHCILQNYNGTPEIKNARLIEYVNNQGNIDVSAYTEATVAEARSADVGAKLKVEGIVARITYANGMKPSGFILVDGESSIYVYSADTAQRVSVGNKVVVAGTKDMWILSSEQTNAATYGYRGCNQLADVTLISNDGAVNTPDYSWAQETTVKELLENPVTNDITTKIFKVNAFINKVPGSGFINYYINDLDYIDSENTGTGSYVYTQCNGSDFSWLDEFDGKICTVYVVIINAKATSSGCVYRFLPVAVSDDGFVFNTADAPAHAVKYYGVDQFFESYSADPSLELITSVSSSLLGFNGVTLTYKSSDDTIIKFTTEEGKTVMHVVGTGKVKVTVTATLDDNAYSETVEITASTPVVFETISVADAIAAENGTEVTIKGIAGPSLINQTGIYLVDETGIVPVVFLNKSDISLISMGNEIVIKGTKTVTKDGGGQICISACERLGNNFGSHDFNTSTFITDKTLADVKALEDTPENTLKVYVLRAKVSCKESQYSTNYSLVDGDNSLALYSGSGSQYAWLSEYVGEELTVTVALCDWNAKGLKGCVLSIVTPEGETVYNTYNYAG